MASASEKGNISDLEKVATPETNSGVKAKVSEKLLKHSHDADAALKAFEGLEGQTIELTEETNKRLLRKIDLHLMPVRNEFRF
jgi:MFS transporter, ACS family, allantoate permease